MPWLSFTSVLVALHVLANVVWIGSILSVALVIASGRTSPHPNEAGALARAIYIRLASPSFGVSFVAGAIRLLVAIEAYAHLPWMHAKIAFALVVIGLHHAIGARAKRMANGQSAASGSVTGLAGALFACAAIVVFLAVLKP